MIDQQIIETLATKVMGWTLGNNYFVGSQRHECFNLPNGGRLLRTHWNPLQNIADATMLLEKMDETFDHVGVYQTCGDFVCVIENIPFDECTDCHHFKGEGKNRLEAIVNAVSQVVA